MAEEDELLTVQEVARRLKLHEETIRRYIRDGRLQAIRLGRTQAGYRIRASAVERFLSGSEQLGMPDDQGKRAASAGPSDQAARGIRRARPD